MAAPVRFWGVVLSVKPRLVLTKFEGETHAKCAGHLVLMDGTRSADNIPAEGSHFMIALGPAARERRSVSPGDLLRGDAHPVPTESQDTPADLYRVGTLRTIARQNEPGGGATLPDDPPRTDAPLTPDEAEAAPRRALNPDNLAETGPCYACPYGVIVPVVRLADPRDYRNGNWSKVPACLGPTDCPHFVPLQSPR